MRWKVAPLALLALLALLATVVVAAWPAADAPPPATGPLTTLARHAADAAGSVPATTSAASIAPASAPSDADSAGREAVLDPGLFGHAFDELGAPLASVLIDLRGRVNGFTQVRTTATDEHGAFGFPGVSGEFEASLPRGVAPPQQVVVPPGQRRTIELRVTVPSVLLEGRVLSGSSPVAARAVRFGSGKEGSSGTITDAHGGFRQVVPVGICMVTVAGPPIDVLYGAADPGWTKVPAPAHEPFSFHLAPQPRHVRRDFVLPSAAIHVTVLAAKERTPVAEAVVQVSLGDRAGGRSLRTGKDGVALFTELPAASWDVSLTSNHHAANAPAKAIVPHPHAAPVALTFLVVGTGTVHAILYARDRARVTPLNIENVSLVLPDGSVRHAEPMRPRGAPMAIFRNVPVGIGALRCEDRQERDGMVYAPLAATDPCSVEVATDRLVSATLLGTRRPVLRIRAFDRDGTPRPQDVVVTGDHGAVRPATTSNEGWASPVPAGTYEVRLRTANGEAVDHVVVRDRDVDREIRVR